MYKADSNSSRCAKIDEKRIMESGDCGIELGGVKLSFINNVCTYMNICTNFSADTVKLDISKFGSL